MAENELIIFGDNDFGFELADIAKARQGSSENILANEDLLKDGNASFRRVAERQKETIERDTAFFEAHDDETILDGLRYIFERGKEVEASGLSSKEVAVTLGEEIPELSILSGLITQGQIWSYKLSQIGFAASLSPEK